MGREGSGELLKKAGIIRNRAKINATINNAKVFRVQKNLVHLLNIFGVLWVESRL